MEGKLSLRKRLPSSRIQTDNGWYWLPSLNKMRGRRRSSDQQIPHDCARALISTLALFIHWGNTVSISRISDGDRLCPSRIILFRNPASRRDPSNLGNFAETQTLGHHAESEVLRAPNERPLTVVELPGLVICAGRKCAIHPSDLGCPRLEMTSTHSDFGEH